MPLTLSIFVLCTQDELRCGTSNVKLLVTHPQLRTLVVPATQRVICPQIFDPDSLRCYKTDFDSATAWNRTGWTEVVTAAYFFMCDFEADAHFCMPQDSMLGVACRFPGLSRVLKKRGLEPVSYTHLTLPTILLV